MNSKAYELYRIDKNVYNELKWLCRQYEDIKREIESCYGVSAVRYDSTGSSPGNRIGDPVQEHSDRAMRLREDIEKIDLALDKTAEEPLRGYLKKAVTTGLRYEYLGSVPCGRQLFYELRRKFFWNLAQLKKG